MSTFLRVGLVLSLLVGSVARAQEAPTIGEARHSWRVAFWSTASAALVMDTLAIVFVQRKSAAEDQLHSYLTIHVDSVSNPRSNDVCSDPANRSNAIVQGICDQGNTSATLANVFAWTGLAATLASGYLLYRGYFKEEPPAVTVQPLAGPQLAGLQAAWRF